MPASARFHRLPTAALLAACALAALVAGPPGRAHAQTASLSPSITADIQVRLTEMEEEQRRLNGALETANHRVRTLEDRLTRLQEDIEFRLTAIERAGGDAGTSVADGGSRVEGGGTPSGGDPMKAEPAPPPGSGLAPAEGSLGTVAPGYEMGPGPSVRDPIPAVDPADPKSRYDNARALLLRKDYAGAEQAFGSFVADYPDHTLAANAQYWLAETYYVRGDYTAAARQFLAGIKGYPKSAKAPDSMLKLGLSLGNMGQTDKACATLGQVGSKYPDAATSIRQRAQEGRNQFRCG